MESLDKIEHFAALGQCACLEQLQKSSDIPSASNGDMDLLWFVSERFFKGEFERVFIDDRVKEIVHVDGSTDCLKQIAKKCTSYLGTDGCRYRQLTVLLIGASALKLFIQSNWTGPAVTEQGDWIANRSEECQKLCINMLGVGGEPCYHLIEDPLILMVAKTLLLDLSTLLKGCFTVDLWASRCAFVHQAVLLDRSYTLYKEIGDHLVNAEKCYLEASNNTECRVAKVQFYMEAAMVHLYYFEVGKSRLYLDKAKLLSDLHFELMGALGKRTYHQQTALPQLLLNVQRRNASLDEMSPKCPLSHFPKNVALTDDTVMNKIQFSDDVASDVSLTPEEQCLILTTCILNKSISAPEPLRDEEVMAYIEKILSAPLAWSVQFSALFQRCKLETRTSRKVERSMSQLQCLVESIKSTSPCAGIRQELFFCAGAPTLWNIERELGHLFFSLGATKAALDVFLKYELWEEVVSCYSKIGRPEKAEAVVRKLLEQEESAHLYCLLGDVTQNPEDFHKAWEISGQTSSRAQRSLGFFYYHKKQFQEAIPHFEKSVELNGVQLSVWFALGYSGMQVENYPLCVKAYKRVVTLDPDSFEAWNNMANAYIHMGEKAKAWKVLQESLKCNYEDWRVWENYLLVSVDVGAFEESIKAWHRLLDIKGKHADGKVAKILVKVVLEGIPDMSGRPGDYLKPKLLELFGRVTSLVTSEPDIWYCYGTLYKHTSDVSNLSEEDLERMLQFFQKSYRCLTQKQSWEKDIETCCNVLRRSRELLDIYLTATKTMANALRKHQLLSSARITARGGLACVDQYKDHYTTSQLEELRPVMQSLLEKLSEVNALLSASE